MSENNDIPEIKIAVMGMDNAGKTTMLNYLLEDRESPSDLPDIPATKGIKKDRIDLFGRYTIIWDFGGQKVYRNKYLQDPKNYFHSITLFFYVVDVQDYVRVFSSAMYFKGVFQLIRKYSPDASIIFLFHKSDPDFSPKEHDSKEKFMNDIKSMLEPSHIHYKSYKTTIFDMDTIKQIFHKEIAHTK